MQQQLLIYPTISNTVFLDYRKMCYKIAANFESKLSRVLLLGSGSLIVVGAMYKVYARYNNNAIEVEKSRDSDDADYIPAANKSDGSNEKNKNSDDEETKDDKHIITETKIKTTFSDVIGHDGAKRNLDEYIQFLYHKDKFEAIGGIVSKGCMIVGKSGVGKTHLVRSMAGQAGVRLYEIFSYDDKDGTYYCNGVKFYDIEYVFFTAKINSPSIIFLDDINKNGWTEKGFLFEMDKLDIKDGVIIMASAEEKDDVPESFFKSKRFDHIVNLFQPDDYLERVEILSYFLSKMTHSLDVDLLARTIPLFTEDKSPKNLKYILNRAAMKSAMENNPRISMKTVEMVMLEMEMGPEKNSASRDKDCEKAVAYHEAGHTLVRYYSKHALPLFIVTITRHGRMGGFSSCLPSKDRFLRSKRFYLADIDICLGGRVGEEILLGEDGVSDGKHGLAIIYEIVTYA